MVFLEEWAEVCVLVPDWWKKYETCRALLVPKRPLFSYVSNIFFSDISCAMTLYRAVASNHSVMVALAFLRCVYLTDEEAKISLLGFDPQMRKNVYKRVLFSFSEAVARISLKAGVVNIAARTRYSPELAHTAVLRSSKIDWDQADCPEWSAALKRSFILRFILNERLVSKPEQPQHRRVVAVILRT